MVLPVPPFNPSAQIPNNPFYDTLGQNDLALCSTVGPLIVGSCLCADVRNATICALVSGGGGGSGTVTRVGTGAGLTGGPITTSGTIALSTSGVTSGTYSFATITVDEYGRVRVAANGSNATSTNAGIVALATNTETLCGSTALKAVTPVSLQFKITDSVSCQDPYRIASSSAVKTAYDTALSRVPSSAYAGKGTLLSGDGAGSYCALPRGGDGQFLTACCICPGGLTWSDTTPGTSGIPCAIICDKGGIVVGTGPGIPGSLFTGPNGTVLTVDSNSAVGVSWCPLQKVDSIPCGCITGKGALITGDNLGNVIPLGVGAEGEYLRVCNACTGGIAWGPSPAGIPISCLTGKGVLITATALGCVYTLPGPACAGQILSSTDSATGPGFEWVDNLALPITDYNVKGRLIVGSANGPCCLDVSFDDYALVACSSRPEGVAWKQVIGAGIPCACLSDGSIIVGCGTSLPYALPVGLPGQVLTVTGDPTCPGGVCWASTGGSGIPVACLTTKGAIVGAGGPSTPVTLAPVSDGLFLASCLACDSGLTWVAAGNSGGIPCACINGKGSLVTGTAANAPFALPAPQTDGFFLVTCATADGGLAWKAESTETYLPTSLISGQGAIVTGDVGGVPTTLSVGGDGCVLIACSVCPEGLTWKTFPAEQGIPCALITGKGALITGETANNPVALPIGTIGQVLTVVDSAIGLAWCPVDVPGGGIPCSVLSAKGALITAETAGNPVAICPGPAGSVLTSCPADLCGLGWTVLPPAGIPCSNIIGCGTIITGTAPNTPVGLTVGCAGQVLKVCPGTPTGLAWADTTEADAIPSSILTSKGGIIVASAGNTPTELLPGTNGLVLTACDTAPLGLAWCAYTAPSSIPTACISGKGSIITGIAANAPVALPVGTEGQILRVCSACPVGLAWSEDNFGIPETCLTAKGDLIAAIGPENATHVPIGSAGQVLTVDPTSSTCVSWINPNGIPCSTICAKGDIVIGSANSLATALPLGSNGQILTACPVGSTVGLVWANPPAAAIPCSVIVKCGDLIVGGAAATPAILPVGSDGKILTACSSGFCGLAWANPPAPAIPCSTICALGDIVIGTNTNTPSALPVGANGQILTACPSDPNKGLAWVNPPAPAIPCSCLALCGQLLAGGVNGAPGPVDLGTDGLILVWCSACPCSMTWTNFIGDPGIPCSFINAKGALITGCIANQPVSLPVGTDGQVLTACDASPTGLCWSTFGQDPGIPCAVITGKGALITGCVANSPTALELGPDGYILKANRACPEGLDWAELVPSIPCALVVGPGSLITGDGAGTPQRLAPGDNGQVLTINKSGSCWLSWCTPTPSIPCSLLGTAGDIAIGTTAGVSALPVGTNCQVLAIDSTCTTTGGLTWKTVADASDRICCSIIQVKGDLIVGTDPGSATRLDAGFTGQVLTINRNNATTWMEWASPVPSVPCSVLAQAGSIAIGTPSGVQTLNAGANGQILAIDCSPGNPNILTWKTVDDAALKIPCACLTQKGSLLTSTGSAICELLVGQPGMYLTAVATPEGTAVGWERDTASVKLSSLVGCGGLITATSTCAAYALTTTSQPDGNVLAVCTLCPAGIGWVKPVYGVPCCCFIQKGVLLAGIAPDLPAPIFPPTIDGSYLRFDQNCGSSGIYWSKDGIPPAEPEIRGGVFACTDDLSAPYNTALGYQALQNGVGQCNTALGWYAGVNSACGCSNTAVGYCTFSFGSAGGSTASFNTHVGALSGSFYLLDGQTAVGYAALGQNCTGTGNTAVGFCSLSSVVTGCENTAIGWGAGQFLCDGSQQITLLGYKAMGDCVTGNRDASTVIGHLAGYSAGNGSTLVGYRAGGCTTVGGSTAVGCFAMFNNTTGCQNSAFGLEALRNNQTGCRNSAFGYSAMKQQDGGSDNTVMGYAAQGTGSPVVDPFVPTGDGNTSIGSQAATGLRQANFNVAVGFCALFTGSNGSSNVAVGKEALKCNTGNLNVAVGDEAMCNNVGRENVAIGASALKCNLTGFENTAIGRCAGFGVTDCTRSTCPAPTLCSGSANTFVGAFSGLCNADACFNTAVGHDALRNNCVNENTAVGYKALCLNTTSRKNTAIGAYALQCNTAESNTAIGFNALYKNTTGYQNVAIGSEALCSNVQGFDNLAFGHRALSSLDTGDANTAIGTFALQDITFGFNNIGIGYLSASNVRNASENIAIGTCAFCGGNSCCNIAIGARALLRGAFGGQSVVVGHDAFTCFLNYCNVGLGVEAGRLNRGNCNVAIGTKALSADSCIRRTISIGMFSMSDLVSGEENIAIGICALKGNGVGAEGGCNQIAIGNNALQCSTQNRQVAIGWCALNTGGTIGDVAIGFCALSRLKNDTGTVQSYTNNTFIGEYAGHDICSGYGSVGIGTDTLSFRKVSYDNTAVGWRAGYGCESKPSAYSYQNTFIGHAASYLMIDSSCSTSLGYFALSLAPQYRSCTDRSGCLVASTAIGWCALASGRSYECMIALGPRAGSEGGYQPQAEGAAGNTIIGTWCTQDNYIAGNRKASIDNNSALILGDAPLGLPYINSLSTHAYKFCDSGTGEVISDEVRYKIDSVSALAAEQADGAPTLMETTGGSANDHHINMDGLTTMMINAIQELSAQVTALQAQVDALSP